jgi:hypothetical protein
VKRGERGTCEAGDRVDGEVQTRVKHRGGGADSSEAPRSTVEAVQTRGGGAESLGLINTGVQVGFVREDFTGAMTWVLGSPSRDV